MDTPRTLHRLPRTSGKVPVWFCLVLSERCLSGFVACLGLLERCLSGFVWKGACLVLSWFCPWQAGRCYPVRSARRDRGTEGTFRVQPLDNPSARVALSTPRGGKGFKRGYQDFAFPKFSRYIADATDMARVIRGKKSPDFSRAHDLNVQAAVLQACKLPLTE